MRRLLPRLRRAFPRARLRIRFDGGFAGPEMLAFVEKERLEYVVAIGKNSVLKRRIEPLMKRVRRATKHSGETETEFGETRYAAGSWRRKKRRVVMKAEVTRLEDRSPRDNARFVVTNLRHTAEGVYQIYRERGSRSHETQAGHLDAVCVQGVLARSLACTSRLAASAQAA